MIETVGITHHACATKIAGLTSSQPMVVLHFIATTATTIVTIETALFDALFYLVKKVVCKVLFILCRRWALEYVNMFCTLLMLPSLQMMLANTFCTLSSMLATQPVVQLDGIVYSVAGFDLVTCGSRWLLVLSCTTSRSTWATQPVV